MSGFPVSWPGQADLGDAAGVPCADVPVDLWAASADAARAAGYVFFDWLSAVDQSDQDPAGFDIVVHLAVPRPLHRLLLRTRLPLDAEIDSLTGVFVGAAWHERETWEMFGVVFTGFDDGTGQGLRPLLLPDGFEGTPLRKSFMLVARAARPWPGAKEPGSSEASASPSRRRTTPPLVPDPSWGPRRPGDPPPEPLPARGARPPRTRRTPRRGEADDA